MKKLLLLGLCWTGLASAQVNHPFVIEYLTASDSVLLPPPSEEADPEAPMFEDDTYVVTRTCSGEWGGSIHFLNKNTGVKHSAAATCAVSVLKHEGRYYVTNTLAHLIGSTDVLEIADPDSLEVFEMPPPRSGRKKTKVYYIGDDESKSLTGTKVLVDSLGVQTLSTFPWEGQLYHLVTDYRHTYLCRIENEQFVTLDTLLHEPARTRVSSTYVSKERLAAQLVNLDYASGYVEIIGNRIRVIRRE